MEPIAVIGRVHALADTGGDVPDGLGVCDSTLTWIHHAEEKQFVFNRVVDANESPTDVVGGDMVVAAAAGMNTAVFAIGQQGSGKSTTLFGPDGIIAYVAKGLLVAQCSVALSLVEIYGDMATDVLHGNAHVFRPQYHPLIGGYGADVARIDVPDVAMLVLRLGIRAMAIDAIVTNKTTTKSSRVVTLHVTSMDGKRWSRVDFVDMAAPGNARRPLVPGDVGYRLEQGPMNLIECAKLLADDVPVDKVPLQGASSLVTLVSHTLGGRCKTFVIAHVIQSALHNDENLGTLRLAMLLRGIRNVVEPNAYGAAYIVSQIEGDVQGERDHLDKVKRQLSSAASKSLHQDSVEVDHQSARTKIKALESVVHAFQKSALERADDWLKFKRRVDNDETKLGSKVVASDRTIHHLHLVRLHDDRLFSGVIAYHVAAADSKMSRDSTADIVLVGGGTCVSAAHCELHVPVPGTVEVVVVGAPSVVCLVNGRPLAAGAAPRALVHGDTLTCGSRNVFRVVHPDETIHPSSRDDIQHVKTYRDAWLDRGAVLQTYRHPLANTLTHDEAQRRCHAALTSILDRIASIRTMFAQSVVDVDDERDVHDVMLQRGAAPPPKYMATRVRPDTIKRLSTAAIAEMNALESRIYSRDTMRLLDAVDEFAAMCQELCTPIDVRAVPMVNHAAMTNDDDPIDRDQLSTDIWVVLSNPSNARERIILRPADFEIRLALLRVLFQQHQVKRPVGAPSTKTGIALSPRVAAGTGDGDPLHLTSTEERIGVARVHLGKLAYYFDVDDALPIVSDAGQVVGHLMVQIQPHVAHTDVHAVRPDRVQFIHRVNHDVDHEEELRDAIGMDVTVAYRVNIRGARGLPPQVTSNVFVEYVFFEDSAANTTSPSACKSRHPVIEQAFMHHVLITDEFCQYVAMTALEFQVFGYRGDHVVAGPQKKRDEMFWMEMEAKAMHAVVQGLQEKVGSLESQLHTREAELRRCRAQIDVAKLHETNDTTQQSPPAVVEAKHPDGASEAQETCKAVGRRRRTPDLKLAGMLGKGLDDIRSGVCLVM
ncbi:hypothetical protein, variant [Aphanomyces invadans]|uniref:Kinesin motor domain-containing protein n=1 Tax=Aphanomyces invadans TaxID=157072 RepID=A0A024U9M9_9STRA|nr:hypothetical protein, variant [Aphanomyces invadans]ETW02597.1 hypothetical protein, variant [Aphanomyces invadans]|eukprot:XP_008869202.1 hypothetical protein, variant [Aphanomyces invadans]